MEEDDATTNVINFRNRDNVLAILTREDAAILALPETDNHSEVPLGEERPNSSVSSVKFIVHRRDGPDLHLLLSDYVKFRILFCHGPNSTAGDGSENHSFLIYLSFAGHGKTLATLIELKGQIHFLENILSSYSFRTKTIRALKSLLKDASFGTKRRFLAQFAQKLSLYV